MERVQGNALEKFLCNWNSEFPNYPLNAVDLKNSHSVIDTLLHVFERLGFDKESILAPLPEELRNEHTMYYCDLLPVINMTRVLNHLVSIKPNVFSMNIMHFLQPTSVTSHSILLLMFNFMLFNEDRLRDISPYEEELFSEIDQVKSLENQKNELVVMLNQQAAEKAERAQRLEKLDSDIKMFEEELKQEKEIHDKEKQELEAILKENQQLDILIEQKNAQRDGLLTEVARKQALRVYDADDVKAKAEQAAQNVKEVEDKMNSLRTTLMLKENCLKNLQTVKPSLEIANNLLKDIARAVDSLKECESGDLDSDLKEGELSLLNTDLSEAQAQLAEAQAARREAAARRHDAQARRTADRATAHSALREAEERDKKCKERCKNALELIEDIKQQTVKYEEEKAAGMKEISNIHSYFLNEQKNMEDSLIKKALEVEKRLSEKMRNKQI